MIKYIIVGYTSDIDLHSMSAKITILDKEGNFTDSKDKSTYMWFDDREDAENFIFHNNIELAVSYGVESDLQFSS